MPHSPTGGKVSEAWRDRLLAALGAELLDAYEATGEHPSEEKLRAICAPYLRLMKNPQEGEQFDGPDAS